MMQREKCIQPRLMHAVAIGCLLADLVCRQAPSLAGSTIALAPGTMARLGTVDERFQSYNIEMVEVTGGAFWRPYNDRVENSSSRPGVPAGMDPALYAYRKPIQLSNPRLRKLAAALGPAYLRVSGTWANTTYFDADGTARAPPTGFSAVLTHAQWKGVVEFATAVDASIVTSFATGTGTRDAQGVWTSAQASQLVAYTHALGGHIVAAEFMNEPDLAAISGAPSGYDASSYGRDTAVFGSFLKRASPETIFLGPGSAGGGSPGALKSEDLMKAAGDVFDAVSFHHYGAASQRCTGIAPSAAARDDKLLSEAWLSGVERAASFFSDLRDKFAPGRPLWITETAQAACGGDRWASTFLDSFRYLDQLGRMARRQVQVVMHNTLAASDYGLLDEDDFAPRPNYWMALLWRKLMGTIVLDPNALQTPNLHLYPHCLRGKAGGVALLAINADRGVARSLELPTSASRYTLSAANLTDTQIRLNGRDLVLGPRDEPPTLDGEPVGSGPLELPPATITFLAISDAANPACR